MEERREETRKRIKLDKEAQERPASNPRPNGCQFFVKRKKRFCKMDSKKNAFFCGEHATESATTKEEPNDLRIPCPLDKKHTVYAFNLAKHLTKCNRRAPENPYVSSKINYLDKIDEKTDNFRLRDVPKEEVDGIISIVERLFTQFIAGKIKSEVLSHEIFTEEMKRSDLGDESLRHLHQASSMIGILKARNLVKKQTVFVDLGAGRGSLSFWLAKLIESEKLEDSKVLVIDRASVRFKRDNKVDDRSIVERIKVDIGDLDITKVDFGSCKSIVGVSKHLCGGATDLAISCLVHANATSIKAQGILICVCCHHQITHNTFVGRDWLALQGVSRRAFEIIIKLASWCTCGDGRSREERKGGLIEDHERRKEMEEIGWKCKRLMDYARVEYLRNAGYEANLSYYVDKVHTLENICIVGEYLQPTKAVEVDAIKLDN